VKYGLTMWSLRARLAGTLAACLPVLALGAIPTLPEPTGNVTLSDKPANAHWAWIGDYQSGNYGRSILYNMDSGELLGMIDTGWEGIGLNFSRSGAIYSPAMFMSRGYRGERTDVVTTFDPHTLNPLREVVVPAKGVHGLPSENISTLTDDDRFLLMQFMTPASSVGVMDVKTNKFVGEIETSGCAFIMAAGNRRFFTLCGDGSALAVSLTEDGKEASRKHYPNLFDADKDPLHGAGVRSGNAWYFVSHRGQVHTVDVAGPELQFQPVWAVAETAGELTWVPGPSYQPLAIHNAKQKLYVLMHPSDLKPKGGGYDFQDDPGIEAWAFDLKTKRRLQRLPLKNPSFAIAVTQDKSPLLYATATFNFMVTSYDEGTGKSLLDISILTFPTHLHPVN
jgi:methylamine dehydrogenase heavy chain